MKKSWWLEYVWNPRAPSAAWLIAHGFGNAHVLNRESTNHPVSTQWFDDQLGRIAQKMTEFQTALNFSNNAHLASKLQTWHPTNRPHSFSLNHTEIAMGCVLRTAWTFQTVSRGITLLFLNSCLTIRQSQWFHPGRINKQQSSALCPLGGGAEQKPTSPRILRWRSRRLGQRLPSQGPRSSSRGVCCAAPPPTRGCRPTSSAPPAWVCSGLRELRVNVERCR